MGLIIMTELILQGRTSTIINGRRIEIKYAVYFDGDYTVTATIPDAVFPDVNVTLRDPGYLTITREGARKAAQNLVKHYYQSF